jgi:rod shape determining protein RodA
MATVIGKRFDWGIFFSLLILATGSLLSLASTNRAFFNRQIFWYIIVFLLIYFGRKINWRWLGGQGWFRHGLYWVGVGLLVLSYFQGTTIRGTKSWLVILGIQFEPVEIMKIGLLFILAHFFSRRHISASQVKNIFLSFFYTAIPAGLVVMHPDFGSTLVIVSVWVGFLFVSGIQKKRLILGFILAILICIFLWTSFLKPYQKDRLTSFIFPERDPFGTSYNVIQSKIAIGSGGIFGKGFGLGTQSQFHFLPEAQTDFIFAAFVEEWGLFGGVCIVAAFFFLLYRLIRIGLLVGDNYSKFVILGTVIIFTLQFFINVGSDLGLLPVTGITFPFFSYGGSSLLTAGLLVGIIEHIKFESSI